MRPVARFDRRGLVAVAVLIVLAAAAAHLSPVASPWGGTLVPPEAVPVPPVPGDGGIVGSLMLLLPLYGVLRFAARFGRTPRGGR